MVAVRTAAPSAGAAGKIFENVCYGGNVQLSASADVEFNLINYAVVDRPAFVCELGATAPTGRETNSLAIVSIPTRIHITPSGAFSFSRTVNVTVDIGRGGESAPTEPTTIILRGHVVAGAHITGQALAAYGTIHASICPVGTRGSFRLAWEKGYQGRL